VVVTVVVVVELIFPYFFLDVGELSAAVCFPAVAMLYPGESQKTRVDLDVMAVLYIAAGVNA
jgi:hypothetical protein